MPVMNPAGISGSGAQQTAQTAASVEARAVKPLAVNKRAVAQSFSRAASQYDQVAQLQMQVGSQLLAMIDRQAAHPVALDIGCGTGNLTQHLQPLCTSLIALDFAPGMLQFARAHHGDCIQHFICADADALPFARNSLDLVFSNFALQWCEALPVLLQNLFASMRPGGQLVFSIPGAKTLWELQQSWQQADPFHRHVNEFMPAETVRTALQNAGFQINAVDVDPVVMRYNSVRELTHELKTLGAHIVNGERNRQLTGKRAVTAMLQAYERLRSVDGTLPATWNVICVDACKPFDSTR